MSLIVMWDLANSQQPRAQLIRRNGLPEFHGKSNPPECIFLNIVELLRPTIPARRFYDALRAVNRVWERNCTGDTETFGHRTPRTHGEGVVLQGDGSGF